MTNRRVLLMHGVAENPVADRFVHRNFLEVRAFEDYLDSRPTKFVRLEQALAGEGDALTLDDATVAAARAADIARERGHEVTLFINPLNVSTRVPYYFLVLNWLLDTTTERRIEFEGLQYDLLIREERRTFRRLLRNHLARARSEESRQDLLRELEAIMHTPQNDLPEFLETLSESGLDQLRKNGVSLGNHGWSHGDVLHQDEPQVRLEITLGREWILERYGETPSVYAVPFGRALPESQWLKVVHGTWLLAADNLFNGWLGPSIFNRTELHL